MAEIVERAMSVAALWLNEAIVSLIRSADGHVNDVGGAALEMSDKTRPPPFHSFNFKKKKTKVDLCVQVVDCFGPKNGETHEQSFVSSWLVSTAHLLVLGLDVERRLRPRSAPALPGACYGRRFRPLVQRVRPLRADSSRSSRSFSVPNRNVSFARFLRAFLLSGRVSFEFSVWKWRKKNNAMEFEGKIQMFRAIFLKMTWRLAASILNGSASLSA